MVSRRQFFKVVAALGAGYILPRLGLRPAEVGTAAASAPAADAGASVARFAQALRGVGPAGIPVAVKDGVRKWTVGAKSIVADHYTVELVEFQDQIHPTLGPTTLWGFNPTKALGVTGTVTPRHLGGIIVSEKGTPVQITFRNKLPNKHILPIDTTLMGADDTQNRVSVHLHGGEVPWISDGNPFAWWDAQGNHGVNFIANRILRPGEKVPANEAEYYYPNNQSARLMWYHDHAIGITRLNAYAGIATAFIIRDNFERSLVKLGLPDFIELGGRELPIVIQDKSFIQKDDPQFPGSAKTAGSLFYPYKYDPADQGEGGKWLPLPEISCLPETFGDTILVNGTVWPKAAVDPRRYRLRILNACQAMFLNLQLYEADAQGNPDFKKPGPDCLVIGAEGGFLARPVKINMGKPFNPDTLKGSLMIAPGERLDVIVDFNGKAGKSYVLFNDAPAPFPMGERLEGDVQLLMRFDVGPNSAKLAADKALNLPASLAGAPDSGVNPPLAVPGGKALDWNNVTTEPAAPPKEAKVRVLTLNEGFDDYGRLIQRLGNDVAVHPEDFSRPYVANDMDNDAEAAATEVAPNGALEVWQICNLTADTHPMHFHLETVQVLSRQPFDVEAFQKTPQGKKAQPKFTGPARGPEAHELGWKETVQMNPGECTTIIMKLDLPVAPFYVPPSPRTNTNEYVWHCHILEHEEHDMMRPLLVTGVASARIP